ncbi:ribosome small subunit-dependent GTPase A [Aliifodinibius sp. S!AR15-10]|uniref:ribosome small subunit-dependent GTPase A n=1 Tax=Aliifodinibius sp. S!AR15-10 TaxID=2950437 RepID=UPI00285E4026|nr:ribosome small subunit-dependent GTPase A [Aliifodinibius sp. S!AR15-10]MDR8391088.1 ribosome small subunit-dependent GTPase A [Aliifodinibius sp. S!AR15-10]
MANKQGRVVQSTGSWYEIAVEDDEGFSIVKCRLPGRFRLEDYNVTNPIAVGDRVDISINEDDTGSIEKIHDRQNFVIRKSTHNQRGEQILAANVDRAFVIQSIRKPRLKPGFIDRFLVTCEAYEVSSFILINKMDLAREKEKEQAARLIDLYSSIGYDIMATSIYDEESLETVKEELKGRTSVFIGHSGVGKTSIINKIDPGIERPTSDVSDYSEKGIHTTTFAKLLPLHFGGYLVDTPGIKEFGLVNIEPWELSLFFPEMLEPRQYCKFNNCTHSHEPGCGVIEAFENGDISAQRYESYLNILESLEEN